MTRRRTPFFTLARFVAAPPVLLAAVLCALVLPGLGCAADTSPGERAQYLALDNTERLIRPLAELGLRARTDAVIAERLGVPPLTEQEADHIRRSSLNEHRNTIDHLLGRPLTYGREHTTTGAADDSGERPESGEGPPPGAGDGAGAGGGGGG